MKQLATYKEPRLTVHKQSFYLMALDLGVSNTEVDDEAAKKRHNDVDNETENWGKVDNSLW